jgi:AcrR family transcriptional regulator
MSSIKTKAVRFAARRGSVEGGSRVERRKARTHQALIDATHSLLASRSIDALSVDEIADCADVAKGTFYNYFADKEALARELGANVRARIEGEISRINAKVSDPAVRIARAFTCVLRFGMREPQQALAMIRMFPHAIDPSAPLNTGVRADVISGLANKRIVAPSSEIGVAFIVGVGAAGLNRVLDLTPEEAVTFTRELGIILLHGLGLSRAQASRIMAAAVASVLTDE